MTLRPITVNFVSTIENLVAVCKPEGEIHAALFTLYDTELR